MPTQSVGSLSAQAVYRQQRPAGRGQGHQEQPARINTHDVVAGARPLPASQIYGKSAARGTAPPQKDLTFLGAVGAVVVGLVLYSCCCNGNGNKPS